MQPKSGIFGINGMIATLSGLGWSTNILIQESSIGPSDLDQIDPFFDSLGTWEPDNREIIVDVERCRRMASGHDPNALIKVVAAHFCAKGVIHLGVHPVTGRTYLGWDDPQKQFSAEGYPLHPVHRHYDRLVREQELFTQIFTWLHLVTLNDPDELAVFQWLSKGHCGLYAIDYEKSPDAPFLPSRLRRDWGREAVADRDGTIGRVRILLGEFTRGVQTSKDVMDMFDPDP